MDAITNPYIHRSWYISVSVSQFPRIYLVYGYGLTRNWNWWQNISEYFQNWVNWCMYVCMYVCMFVCMYVCMYICVCVLCCVVCVVCVFHPALVKANKNVSFCLQHCQVVHCTVRFRHSRTLVSVGINHCISQNNVGCNYLSLPDIPASSIKVLTSSFFLEIRQSLLVWYLTSKQGISQCVNIHHRVYQSLIEGHIGNMNALSKIRIWNAHMCMKCISM